MTLMYINLQKQPKNLLKNIVIFNIFTGKTIFQGKIYVEELITVLRKVSNQI
jgi:hypothetical protein